MQVLHRQYASLPFINLILLLFPVLFGSLLAMETFLYIRSDTTANAAFHWLVCLLWFCLLCVSYHMKIAAILPYQGIGLGYYLLRAALFSKLKTI